MEWINEKKNACDLKLFTGKGEWWHSAYQQREAPDGKTPPIRRAMPGREDRLISQRIDRKIL
jgi:hypothetical protein